LAQGPIEPGGACENPFRGAVMIAWIANMILSLAGWITEWFVARNSTNFDVVQMMVATFVLAFICFVAAIGPIRWINAIRRGDKAE
jgi:hypothetical protein